MLKFQSFPFSLTDPSTYINIVVKPNSVIRFFANEDIEIFNELLEESADGLDNIENRLLKFF